MNDIVTCEFVVSTGARPCEEPAPRELAGRALCDEHLLFVLGERSAKARRHAGLLPSSAPSRARHERAT